ncbi:MAG: hypothetical protein RLZZ324_182 [Candidatus Parcubacteria bacterium]|jgi:hypothetical protein
MREGFNPAAAEMANEGGASEARRGMESKEKSFLESLKAGAEKYRLAAMFAFAGALAGAMEGRAAAQEYDREADPSALIEQGMDRLTADMARMKERYDNLEAPFAAVPGFEEAYHDQRSSATTRVDGVTEEGSMRLPELRLQSGDVAKLKDKRLLVSASSAMLSYARSAADSGPGGTARHMRVNESAKSDVTLYAAPAEQQDAIAKAQAFQTVGWGTSENEAVANALKEAAMTLGKAVKKDEGGFMQSMHEATPSGDTETVEQHHVTYAGVTGLAVIEGFTVTGVETQEVDGVKHFVAHVEGLGSSVDISQPPAEL